MKKYGFVYLFFLLSSICFAQQNRLGDIELFAGMPFLNGTLDYQGKEERFYSENPSFAFGFAAVNYSVFGNDSIGLFSAVNIFRPKAFTHYLNKEEVLYDQNINATDIQFGVTFRVLEAGYFKFPFSTGLHIFIMSGAAGNSSLTTWQLQKTASGIYTSAAAELHINQTVYFFVRLQLALDYVISTNSTKYTPVTVGNRTAYYIDQNVFQEIGIYTIFTPVLGLGIKTVGFFDK